MGGGVRSEEVVRRYLEAGVLRVILGTAAVTDPGFTRDMVKKYGAGIAVGVDIRDGFVATHGWTETSDSDCFGFCRELAETGVQTIICTDISRDGAMKGTNLPLYRQLRQKGILVRHFDRERIAAYNRISIGTEEQMDRLLEAVEDILKEAAT